MGKNLFGFFFMVSLRAVSVRTALYTLIFKVLPLP